MQLERVEAVGFFNFNEPFVLDCRDLPDGLIAVIGPNGAGKTGLALDSPIACLYGPGSKSNAFPSRDGSLATYATSPHAYLDTVWSIAGQGVFHARVNVDNLKRKTEAVLRQIVAHGDGVDAVRDRLSPDRGTPINDGLVSTYRDAVAAHFPTLRSLLASAYAAQNKRGGFGELSQTDRIALFRELADLAHLEDKAQTAKECRDLAEQYVERVRIEIDTLQRDASPALVRGLTETIDALARSIADATQRADAIRTQITALQAKRPQLADEAERHATERARLSELSNAVTDLTTRLATARATFKQQCDAHQTASVRAQQRFVDANLALDVRVTALTSAHAAHVADRRERIRNNRLILDDAERIRAAADRIASATRDLSALRQHLSDAQRDRLNAGARLGAVALQLAERRKLQSDLDDATRRAGLLTTVKFGPDCAVEPVCPLVTDAVSAQQRIPDLTAAIGGLTELAQQQQHWQHIADTLGATIHETARNIRAHEKTIATDTVDANKLPYLQHAEQRIAEYEADLVTSEQAHADALDAIVRERAELETRRFHEMQEAARAFDAAQVTADEADKTLAAALSTAETRRSSADAAVRATEGAKAALDRLDEELRHAMGAQSEHEQTRARDQSRHDELVAQRAGLETKLAQIDALREKHRRLEDEQLAWATLARACGRDGLQRLEIDAAGPIVSDLANQLLRVGYGPRFSVELVTQVPTADGKDVKEKFTIDAIDNANGGDRRDIGDLSGGERVVVEEAVRAALQCYVSLRSRHKSLTLWRDETTGALDPENAPRYVAMLRKLRDISKAHHVFFVTHSMDCAQLADAQVRVEHGQCTIALPPYRSR